MAVTLRQRLLDNVLPDRAALDEALTSHERELRALSEYVEALERALADAEAVAADAQAQLQADRRLRHLAAAGPDPERPGGQIGCEGASSASSACSGWAPRSRSETRAVATGHSIPSSGSAQLQASSSVGSQYSLTA